MLSTRKKNLPWEIAAILLCVIVLLAKVYLDGSWKKEKIDNPATPPLTKQSTELHENKTSLNVTPPKEIKRKPPDTKQVISECDPACKSSLTVLRDGLPIDEETYERIVITTEEIAAYVENNEHARFELIDLAATSDDGNKRDLIIAVFYQLEIEHQRELGQAMIESFYPKVRKDGIDFLANPKTMNASLAATFSSQLQVEPDMYIRTSLINALNQPKLFHGNQEILDTLSLVIQADPDPQVRGKALLASGQLHPDPQDMFYDILSAVRSSEPKFQMYGLQTLELVINNKGVDRPSLSPTNEIQLKNIFDELRKYNFNAIKHQNRRHAEELFNEYFG